MLLAAVAARFGLRYNGYCFTVSSFVILSGLTTLAASEATFCFSILSLDGAFQSDRAVDSDDLDVVGIGRERLVGHDKLTNLLRGMPVGLRVRLIIGSVRVISILVRVIGRGSRVRRLGDR